MKAVLRYTQPIHSPDGWIAPAALAHVLRCDPIGLASVIGELVRQGKLETNGMWPEQRIRPKRERLQ